MKHKKILYLILIFTMISLIILFSTLIYKNSNKSQTLILGNPIENTSFENIDETFTSSFMTSSFLLKMIENDASKQSGDKLIKLSQLIKNSKTIIVNIGSVDLDHINDEEILARQGEITLNNIKSIVKMLLTKSKNADIYISLLNLPESIELAKIYENINDQIKKIATENGINTKIMSFFVQ